MAYLVYFLALDHQRWLLGVKVSKPGFLLSSKLHSESSWHWQFQLFFLAAFSHGSTGIRVYRALTLSLCTRDGRLPMLKLEINFSCDVVEE